MLRMCVVFSSCAEEGVSKWREGLEDVRHCLNALFFGTDNQIHQWDCSIGERGRGGLGRDAYFSGMNMTDSSLTRFNLERPNSLHMSSSFINFMCLALGSQLMMMVVSLSVSAMLLR